MENEQQTINQKKCECGSCWKCRGFFGSKLNTVLLLVLIVLMVIALKWMYEEKNKYWPGISKEAQDWVKTENKVKELEQGNLPSNQSWVKSPLFGLYYSSNFNTPTEFYRVSGLGPDRGNIVYEPSADTVPVFSFTFSGGRASITWGDVWLGGYMPGICTNDEFGQFEYGVSSVACVKGYRAWVSHFSARDSISKEELKIFGDFVLKNK